MIMLKREKLMSPVGTGLMTQTQQRTWAAGIDVGMSGKLGRQSPMSVTPDPLLSPSPSSSFANGSSPSSPSSFGMSNPINTGSFNNSSNIGSGSVSTSPPSYPPNHPLSASKHLCSICGDRASGKHYGVYSCEGCKGFFKRTVRKDLKYSCREDKSCIIDKRQRNRCQYCRYHKCIDMGMKREAVQEERQRTKGERAELERKISNNSEPDMPVELIREAELITMIKTPVNSFVNADLNKKDQAVAKQSEKLVVWAKHVPHFCELPIEDQAALLNRGWNELLILGFAHRSIDCHDAIVLPTGIKIYKHNAESVGVDAVFDRVLSELVTKMREMKVDLTELGCLKSIVLFNSDTKNLRSPTQVEMLQEKVYTALEEYTKTQYPNEPGRFPKLLLRLPALRTISLNCKKQLFIWKSLTSDHSESERFFLAMLEDNLSNGCPVNIR